MFLPFSCRIVFQNDRLGGISVLVLELREHKNQGMNGVVMYIYGRLTKTGTISEPNGYSDPRFSLPSTINWMRAMAMIAEHEKINSAKAKSLYRSVSPRKMTEEQENTIFEQLVFALHDCSALRALRHSQKEADVVRVGIVSWYYGIYAAASAMTTAKDGSFQNSHTGTIEAWDRQIASNELVCPPFNTRISSLMKDVVDVEPDKLSAGSKFFLAGRVPLNVEEARAACHAYFSGTIEWWRKETDKKIKKEKDFRSLGVNNFRTKKAREIRNKSWEKKAVGFLHQAFRSRGKTHYRDAIFLSYDASVSTNLSQYLKDLSTVLEAFVSLSGMFCSRRLSSVAWNNFLRDLEAKRTFSLAPSSLWR